VYSQVDAIEPESKVLDHLRRGEIDYITLTSSNIARALAKSLDEPARARLASGEVKLITISPVTTATVKEMGLPVAAEATEATTEGLLDALVGLAAHHSPLTNSTPVLERVPPQVQHDAAGNHAENVDRAAETAEGEP
jgi:uroporphyrinogen III methyltransferase/synthase